MAKTYPVKWMSSTFRGAPQIDGSAGGGGYLAALHAFLITGFGESTALSVSVTDGVGTAVFAAGISFEYYSVVLFAGVTSPASLNGEARILSVSGSTVTFETDAPNGVATGTITCRYAPVGGWSRPFSATGKGVFQSTDPQSPKFCLRVDDTGTNSARIRGFESMTDVDTGVNPFPTDAQISGGGYHVKSTATTTAAVRYFIVADSRAVYPAIAAGTATSAANLNAPIRGFGDMVALSPSGDAFATAISCQADANTASNQYSFGSFSYPNSSAHALYLPRLVSGAAGAIAPVHLPYVGGAAVSGADATGMGAFPSSIDGQLKYTKRYIAAADGRTPRADIPGVLHIPQTGVYGQIAHGDLVPGAGALSGRKLLAIGCSGGTAVVITGLSLIDITGPWR